MLILALAYLGPRCRRPGVRLHIRIIGARDVHDASFRPLDACAHAGLSGFVMLEGSDFASLLAAGKGRGDSASSRRRSHCPAVVRGGRAGGRLLLGRQGVFQHVKGVTGAVSGYAGGRKNTASTRPSAAAAAVMRSRCGLRSILDR